jgi:hypothetical protein
MTLDEMKAAFAAGKKELDKEDFTPSQLAVVMMVLVVLEEFLVDLKRIADVLEHT